MNIIHIIEASATGTLSMVEMLANQQIKQHSVTVVYSVREETPSHFTQLFDPRISLVYVDMKLSRFVPAIVRLRHLFKQHHDAIIHCHSSVAGFIGRLALFNLPNRCFYNPHCIAFMRQDISPRKRHLFVLLERFANIIKAKYIACSQSEADAIAHYLPHADVHLVENGVDLDPIMPYQKQLESNCESLFNIVTVGSIRPQKDPDSFRNIAQAFMSSPNINFTWVGDGDAQSRLALERAGVIVTGWHSRDEVLKHLAFCDVYLSTSLWEGLPVALMEAQAIGLVLVVRDCAGNRDMVLPEVTGKIFTDVYDAIACLQHVISHPKEALVMAKNAQQAVPLRFSIERYVTAIEAIYLQ
jgi:glycosyltransferase involved in cell wall biosynthesis